MQVLCRRTKNNPVLLGEAGVGKTAIVEGLAQRIISGEVPDLLHDRRLVVLDLAAMVAGTKYRGQFEERIKAVMNEVRRAKNVMLFIDEIHTLVGAGGAEGAIDASNVLKPAMARGEIQCIGATTFDEYRKYIEKDAALARRFQPIPVDPPNAEQTIEIIKGLRGKYEEHHKVKITDDAVVAAVELSDRYITGRVQPDKSIDAIDEAGARVRLKSMTKPPDLADIEADIERLTVEKDEAVKAADYERAAELRDKAEGMKAKKAQIQKDWREKSQQAAGVVDEEVISEVISKMTGVPLKRLKKEEAQRLMELEAELHKKVVSQDDAIKALARAIRRSRAGLKDPKRPMGSFIFCGPSGVGKTLVAKAVADFMFGDEDALITLDMSEYMEKHNVSRLVGAPPGYVGYEEGGQLTERVRRRPYCVILLDEVEKAHPDVFNMLLQIMEEGRLTDSFGRAVDFRNTILIMTSNIGADLIKGGGGFGFSVAATQKNDETRFDNIKSQLLKEVERFFRPEFINRLDDVIVFRPLTKDNLINIVDLEVNKVTGRLQQQGIKLVLDQRAKDFLIEKGYNPDFGARPLRRAVGQYLEDQLSEMLLLGDIKPGTTVTVVRKADENGKDAEHLSFTTEHAPVEKAPAATSTGTPPPAAAASGSSAT